MPEPASYLIAYEATDRGADALRLGAALAGLTGATLHVCLVLPDRSPVPAKVPANTREYEAVLTDQGEGWLDAARAQLPEDLDVRTELVWAESPSEGLIEAARRHDVDRIVVGASRHGLLQRFTIGSVANALLHASPVPVALAPRGYRTPDTITRVTCAVGTRPGWQSLLESTAAIVEGLDVELRLVTLVEVDGDDADGSSDDHLAEVLEQFTSSSVAGAGTLAPITTTVAHGRSLEAAVDTLDWRPDEIVLVGSSRLAVPSRVFLGVTANRMLHALPVPLIVVPTAAH